MSSASRSRARLGLPARLTLWTIAVLGASTAAGFAWVHHGLRAVLEERVDAALGRKGAELAAVVRGAGPGAAEALEAEARREAEAYRDEGLVVVIRRPGRVRVAPSTPAARRFAERIATAAVDAPPRTTGPPGCAGRLRALRIGLSPPWEAGSTLDLALSLAETEATLARFDRRVAAGGLAFLGLAVAGGLALARQALRPVTRSIRTVRDLNPADLSARLSLTGSGDALDQLAATVNDLLDRLAAYHDQAARFTADASHELRSPLAAMRSAIEVALQRPRDADAYRDVLATLGERADRLAALVNGLLLLARADAGQVELRPEPLDLASLAADVAELFRPLAEERGIALACDLPAPVPVVGDRPRLRQLVTNLVDNAIKFTEPGGSVTLRAARHDGRALLEVADTGAGIPADRLPHVFDRFYQADPARSSEGAGLGLSIGRWIAEAHGGAIRAESLPGRGSTFTVLLPCGNPGPLAGPASHRAPRGDRGG